MTIQSAIDTGVQLSYDEWLHEAIRAFGADQRSVEVNFRELAPAIKAGGDRYTHLIHSYPAKLLASIPYVFLRCPSIAPPGAHVLDPFCGSGTVLLEAALAGFRGDGADANPLARHIAAVKLTSIDRTILWAGLEQILLDADDKSPPPDVVNIAHWYDLEVITRLAAIRGAVAAIGDDDVRRFFEVCLSACARKVSKADPRLSVPVKLNRERLKNYGAKGEKVIARLDRITADHVGPMFRTIACQNIERLCSLSTAVPGGAAPTIFSDARALGEGDGRYDLVITSPPYVGAQKYIRASSLGLGWLGLTPGGKLRHLERLNIGREHYTISEYASPQETGFAGADEIIATLRATNPLRAHIASNYLVEMAAAFKETARVVRDGGWLVLISGQNLICGTPFDTPSHLETIATHHGFVTRARLVDDIKSRGLMTKRNRTAGLISQEVVTVMQKNDV